MLNGSHSLTLSIKFNYEHKIYKEFCNKYLRLQKLKVYLKLKLVHIGMV